MASKQTLEDFESEISEFKDFLDFHSPPDEPKLPEVKYRKDITMESSQAGEDVPSAQQIEPNSGVSLSMRSETSPNFNKLYRTKTKGQPNEQGTNSMVPDQVLHISESLSPQGAEVQLPPANLPRMQTQEQPDETEFYYSKQVETKKQVVTQPRSGESQGVFACFKGIDSSSNHVTSPPALQRSYRSGSGYVSVSQPEGQSMFAAMQPQRNMYIVDDMIRRLKNKCMYLQDLTLGDKVISSILSLFFSVIQSQYSKVCVDPSHGTTFMQVAHTLEEQCDIAIFEYTKLPRQTFIEEVNAIIQEHENSNTGKEQNMTVFNATAGTLPTDLPAGERWSVVQQPAGSEEQSMDLDGKDALEKLNDQLDMLLAFVQEQQDATTAESAIFPEKAAWEAKQPDAEPADISNLDLDEVLDLIEECNVRSRMVSQPGQAPQFNVVYNIPQPSAQHSDQSTFANQPCVPASTPAINSAIPSVVDVAAMEVEPDIYLDRTFTAQKIVPEKYLHL